MMDHYYLRWAFRLSVIGAALFFLIAGSLTAQTDEDTRIRAVQVVADAPPVDVYLDDITPATISGVKYLDATASLRLPAGGHNLKIGATGAPKEAAVINQDIALNMDSAYTIFATGQISTLNVQPVVLTRWLGLAPTPGRSLLRVFHAAPGAGDLDISVVDAIGTQNDLSGVMFRSSSSYMPLPEGALEVIVRASGGDEVYRASGNIPQGALMTIVATGDPLAGTFKLNVLFDSDSLSRSPMDTLRKVDKNPIGFLRIVNASPDAGSTQIFVDGQTDETGIVDFRDATGIADIPAKLYTLKFAPEGAEIGASFLEVEVEVLANLYRAAYILGNKGDQTLDLLVLTADASATPAPGKASIRFLNASPDIGVVNIEVAYSSGPARQINSSGFRNFVSYEGAAAGITTVHVTSLDGTEQILTASGTIPPDTQGTLILTGTIAEGNLGVNLLIDNDTEEQLPMILFEGMTGVETEKKLVSAMDVLPNPVRDRMTLRFSILHPERLSCELYSITGEKLFANESAAYEAGEHTISMDMKNLTAGTYITVLRNSAGESIGARQVVVR